MPTGDFAVNMEYETPFLMDLMKKIRYGSLAPAAFQRPYVWNKEDVEAFFTSILERWPIGSFLLWSPLQEDQERLSRGRLGPIVSENERCTLVLDGQNRLATLAWAMFTGAGETLPDLEYSDAERETWLSGEILVADFERRSIRFVATGQHMAPTRLPVGVVADNFLLNKAGRQMEPRISDEAFEWFDLVASRIREARSICSVINNATVEEARYAFLHIARTGVPISEEDFDAAVSWTDDPRPGR